MSKFIISGFSDEICPEFKEQLRCVKAWNVDYIEVRGVDGKNISAYTPEEAVEIKKTLDEYGVKISSIGSPIGKIGIEDDFAPHFESFKNVCELCKVLDTKYIRMFSFYIPQGKNPADYREEVLNRLKAFIDYAKEQGIVLLHENEKGIYGDNAERCLDLMKELYCENFKAVFDFANFIQCEQETMEAYEMLKNYIAYVHIKDAVGPGVVPAGMGDGKVKDILSLLKAKGFEGFLSLEPHLSDFTGFNALENGEEKQDKIFSDGHFAWQVALNALKGILYDLDM
ncbi:MAG: sugar phosphate isomerase/epimerase [Ruminococcaceae bacterium]|nr:sugar phosphate isomerase/epimerase [Oscillospiraceae bacterium]